MLLYKKIVAHDFRYDPRNFTVAAYYHLTLYKKVTDLSPHKFFGFTRKCPIFIPTS